MRFKLDENLPRELADLFREAGHEIRTILDQDLGGARDQEIAVACRREHRALINI